MFSAMFATGVFKNALFFSRLPIINVFMLVGCTNKKRSLCTHNTARSIKKCEDDKKNTQNTRHASSKQKQMQTN